MGKVLFSATDFLDVVIENCRKDTSACAKFLSLARESCNECKFSGNLSKLTIFCLRILKIRQHVNGTLLANAIFVLYEALKNNNSALKTILEANIEDLLEVYEKSPKAKTESLSCINSFISLSINN